MGLLYEKLISATFILNNFLVRLIVNDLPEKSSSVFTHCD